ncbi:MAG: BamA/TamA family outer membrane protein [Bdellovibrio sp.]|nr:BamA/TamA family outer membrane protein [Bdellovibrio sp.]
MRKIVLLFLFVNLVLSQAYAQVRYQLNLSDWPVDVAQKMKKDVPELKEKTFSEENLNIILKKLDQKMQFNSLKIVKTESDNSLRLVGEISANVDKIEFEGLKELSEAEALTLTNLTLKNALDEENLKLASQKLVQYYRDLGYRTAEIRYEIISESTIKKTVIFYIDTKKRTRVSKIQIEGLDADSTVEIERALEVNFLNDMMTQENLNKLNVRLKTELNLHGYYLIPVTSPQVIFSADELKARVVYKFKTSQRYQVELSNLVEFTTSRLEDDVLKLNTYYTKDSNFGPELVEKLKTFYFSEGYPHIEVALSERKKANVIVLSLYVSEGPYTRLKKIRITGQYSRDEKFYISKLLDLSSAKVSSRVYIKEDIELGVKNLVVYLQNDGYVNARVGRVQIMTDRDIPREGQVTIQLEEGPRVTIASIDFLGARSVPREILLEIIKLNPGQSLSLLSLEQALINLKNYYASLGFIEYKLLNESKDLMTYSEKNTLAHLKFEIIEGPKVEVQSILIEGNNLTHDKVILTEIDFKVGDILTPAKINESISRLLRTGHFSSVDISTLEAGTDTAQRTVLIKVSERDPGVFAIGGGVTNENNGTVHGYTGIAYRNFGGWGRGVSARAEGNYNYADIAYIESKITLGAVEPYLFESRARLRLNLTRSRAISNFEFRKVTELNSTVLSVEQDFTSHLTGIWDLFNVTTYVDKGITPEDEAKYLANTGEPLRQDLVIGSTGPTVDFDYRDNLFNPTKGSFSRFSIEYASGLTGSSKVDDFIRLNGQTTFYIPFKETGIVFAQSYRAGYIRDVKGLSFGIPFDKKGFSLGGRSTIRGFSSSEFFPSNAVIGANFKMQTFASYDLVKSELRFPLVNKWDLSGAIFYDGGQVLVDRLSFEDNWRDAVGIGLRYNTPVGPLNLEYGHKLDRKEGEDEGAFHLSIGVF